MTFTNVPSSIHTVPVLDSFDLVPEVVSNNPELTLQALTEHPGTLNLNV